jgi:hypothetical protein
MSLALALHSLYLDNNQRLSFCWKMRLQGCLSTFGSHRFVCQGGEPSSESPTLSCWGRPGRAAPPRLLRNRCSLVGRCLSAAGISSMSLSSATLQALRYAAKSENEASLQARVLHSSSRSPACALCTGSTADPASFRSFSTPRPLTVSACETFYPAAQLIQYSRFSSPLVSSPLFHYKQQVHLLSQR